MNKNILLNLILKYGASKYAEGLLIDDNDEYRVGERKGCTDAFLDKIKEVLQADE